MRRSARPVAHPRPRRIAAAVLGLIFVAGACSGAPEPPKQVLEPEPERPNIVFLLTDDQTLRSLKKMPYLSKRPGGRWVTFKNGFVSTPLCCPSRASIMTGRYSHHTDVVRNDGRPFDNDETIAVWLDDAGYRTGFVGKYLNTIHKVRGEEWIAPGWDDWVDLILDRRQKDFYNYRLNVNGRLVDKGGKPRDYQTDVFTRKAVRFIRSGNEDPFFLWVPYRSPHKPATPAPRHKMALRGLQPRLAKSFNEKNVRDKPRWVRRLPDERARKMRREAAREIGALLSVDDSVKEIIGALKEEREFGSTVIIFLSDNGYSRGDHRWSGKVCPYEGCIRVPFLIRYPGATQRNVFRFASNVDVATTIADLAGAEPTLPQDGRSLVPLLEGRHPRWRNDLLIVWRDRTHTIPAYWGLRTPRWKYVRYRNGEEELYNLKKDPAELMNRADDRKLRPVARRLWRRIKVLRDSS